jgi:hypothetical protein
MQRFVKCVDTAGKDYLELGKEYAVVGSCSFAWRIVSDEGYEFIVPKIDFEEVKYDGVS